MQSKPVDTAVHYTCRSVVSRCRDLFAGGVVVGAAGSRGYDDGTTLENNKDTENSRLRRMQDCGAVVASRWVV